MSLNILITGASGFIGKNFIDLIKKKKKYKILSISRYKKKNKPNSTWLKNDFGNLSKKTLIEIRKFEPKVVIHLGWQDIPNFSSKISKINLIKSKSFLNEVFKIKSVKKIIITGSCNEYLKKKGRASEDTSSLNTKNFFSKSKIELYNFVKKKSERRNVVFYWLRLFYVYGPNQRSQSLIPYVFEKIIHNLPFKINNPKKNLDFINVKDVVKIIEYFVIKKFNKGIYNVGTGKKLSVAEIYNYIALNILKKKIKRLKISKKDFFVSDNKKFKRLFPKYNFLSFQKGLQSYYTWYLKN